MRKVFVITSGKRKNNMLPKARELDIDFAAAYAGPQESNCRTTVSRRIRACDGGRNERQGDSTRRQDSARRTDWKEVMAAARSPPGPAADPGGGGQVLEAEMEEAVGATAEDLSAGITNV
jgi:hypothetical protein